MASCGHVVVEVKEVAYGGRSRECLVTRMPMSGGTQDRLYNHIIIYVAIIILIYVAQAWGNRDRIHVILRFTLHHGFRDGGRKGEHAAIDDKRAALVREGRRLEPHAQPLGDDRAYIKG